MRRTSTVLLVGLALVGAGILVASLRVNPYFYFAAYVILQYVVIAPRNILGATGLRDFGTPSFRVGASPRCS